MKLKQNQTQKNARGIIPASGSIMKFSRNERERWLQIFEYTPSTITQILDAANAGEISQLAIAAREIQERNWDVVQSMQVRKSAMTGLEWHVEPGDTRKASADTAKRFEEVLRGSGGDYGYGSFHALIDTLMDAVISPVSIAEIIWGDGGSIKGFRAVGGWHITYRNSHEPLMITEQHPEGEKLPEGKFVVCNRGGCSDPARSGLIRTLIWLHVFQNYPIKDLVSFVERYGMPFVVAKVDRNSWENEREVMKNLIRSFGPNGGGVFTKSMELELLQSNSTGGEVYFKLLDYTSKAITKVLLGQLASSAEPGGMSKSDAQSKVRHDLLEADARAIEEAVNQQLIVPWMRYYGEQDAAMPRLRFDTERTEGREVLASIVKELHAAGLDADCGEMSSRFGMRLTRKGECGIDAGKDGNEGEQ